MVNRQSQITAVICSHDRYDVLTRAILSVSEQDLPAERYRILVVDNSPDPERASAFGARFGRIPSLSYLHEPARGLSHARNRAVSECGTEFIAFLDDDALASRHWLGALLAAFTAYGEAAAVAGGRVLPVWGAPRPPWLHDHMLGSLSLVDWGDETRPADQGEWLCGTNICFRTQAIRDCGGFAAHLGRHGSGGALLSNEEIQLVARIRARGGLVIYAPAAEVEHLVDATRLTQAWFRKRMAWQAVSDFLMEPERFAHQGPELWLGVRNYLAARPPHERSLGGLLANSDDPELFHWQLGAIYALTAGILDGFEGVRLD